MKIKNLLILFAAVAVFASCGNKGEKDVEIPVGECQDTVSSILGFAPEDYEMVSGKVKNGQFFSTLMNSLGLSNQEAYNLTQACGDEFDVRLLKVGYEYKAYYSKDTLDNSVLEYVVYEKDKGHNVVFKCTEPYLVKEVAKPVEIEQKYADVTINTSLWNDMIDAGVSPLLILTLSDIYAWTIDFFGLQKGDRFRVLYDQKVCDGDVIAVDTVRYAIFTHRNEDLAAIMFDQKDGGNIYWNEKGESMRKAFLKAPLKYSRISSGFSYARRHPVTRKVQPHTGVDYAAPKGTPVQTIGDGVVTSMKYEGAGGNVVRIKHNSVYKTAYLHLSKYAKGLKVGQRVRQGDIIGYVGSTGRSTGPHLDFRVWKNGSPINPLKMDSPPAEPVKDQFKDEFRQTHENYSAQIDRIQAQSLSDRLFEMM